MTTRGCLIFLHLFESVSFLHYKIFASLSNLLRSHHLPPFCRICDKTIILHFEHFLFVVPGTAAAWPIALYCDTTNYIVDLEFLSVNTFISESG